MIFIVVKFQVKDGDREGFLAATREFTEATRAEPGNKWYEWSLSVENPNEVVLIEAFEDDAAEAHVESEHFAQGMESIRPWLTATPKILSRAVEGDGWDEMEELKVS
ncbi:MAG: putative quinol monooxygenase [Rothia sp. (in: high G+C Gram-positive bacteria)]|nr:putative quinol monooxygenase [Rothia sp. (in: high G+C Gram-positive bacteria)]